MKNHLIIITLVTICSSCMVTKFTHQEVMDGAIIGLSKDEIVINFGIPDEKRIEGSYEEWIYDMREKTITVNRPSSSTTKARVTPGYNQINASMNTRTYGGSSISRTYRDYIMITFQNDKAIKWNSRGVDYSIKEASGGKTLVMFLLSIGAGVLTYIILSNIPIY